MLVARIALLLGLLLPAAASAAPPKPPRLVAVIVVDQLGFDALQRARQTLRPGGVERLLTEGTFFSDVNYAHQNTYTGPGHATIASGSYGYKNGIVSNKFYDRVKRKTFSMLVDPAHPMLEAPTEAAEDDTSPANFIGEGLGDALIRTSGGKAKVVSVALKDRAAILLAGRQGQAWWFSEPVGKMTTSTWYTKELPAWVKAFNERRLPEAAYGKSWERAQPEKVYQGADDNPWEQDGLGLGRTFPHPLTGGLERPGTEFYRAFALSSFGVDYTTAFARAALEAEGLGRDETPDLLLVSFSSTDYAGHAFGPDSHEAQDLVFRVDRAVAELLPALEKAAGGRQNLLVGFVSDHGAAPVPEQMAGAGTPAARIKKAQVREVIQQRLRARFGEGDWIVALEDPSIFLNHDLVAQKAAQNKALTLEAVQTAAGEAAMQVQGIGGYYTHAQLVEGRVPATPLGRAVQLSFHPERSGDVVLVTRPFYFWGRYAEKSAGSAHGSPYRYDTHVPMAFWGYGVRPAIVRGPVDAADFAPTLAQLLGITAPAAADGFGRPEVR